MGEKCGTVNREVKGGEGSSRALAEVLQIFMLVYQLICMDMLKQSLNSNAEALQVNKGQK